LIGSRRGLTHQTRWRTGLRIASNNGDFTIQGTPVKIETPSWSNAPAVARRQNPTEANK